MGKQAKNVCRSDFDYKPFKNVSSQIFMPCFLKLLFFFPVDTLIIHAYAKVGIPLTWIPKWIFNLNSVNHA